MARSMQKRGLAEGLTLPSVEEYIPEEISLDAPEQPKESVSEADMKPEKTEAETMPDMVADKSGEIPEKQPSRRGRKPGSLNKPKAEPEKQETEKEKYAESTRVGLAKGWKRNTFVFHEDNLELLRCYAFENRMKEKDVINQALNEFFERHPVKMK